MHLTLPQTTALSFTQVLVGAHAVLANGGIIAPCGIHMVALAARKHSIPFVVLVGLHKLSPLFPHDPDLAYNGGCQLLGAPARAL
jgi:translation initiation factor eIF-2B subunit beta